MLSLSLYEVGVPRRSSPETRARARAPACPGVSDVPPNRFSAWSSAQQERQSPFEEMPEVTVKVKALTYHSTAPPSWHPSRVDSAASVQGTFPCGLLLVPLVTLSHGKTVGNTALHKQLSPTPTVHAHSHSEGRTRWLHYRQGWHFQTHVKVQNELAIEHTSSGLGCLGHGVHYGQLSPLSPLSLPAK